MADLYFEEWLQLRDGDAYETYWCQLKAVTGSNTQTGAKLVFYEDRRSSLNENKKTSPDIQFSFGNGESIECTEISGGIEKEDCRFKVSITRTVNKTSNSKMDVHFCAYDQITRERWIYVICDLVGNCLPPSKVLPTEQNCIRATRPRPKRKIVTEDSRTPSDNRGEEKQSIRSYELDLKECSWYYGKITKYDLGELIYNARIGEYLLRTSESQPNTYVLTVRYEDGPKHMKIMKTHDGKFKISERGGAIFFSPIDAAKAYLTRLNTDAFSTKPIVKRSPEIPERRRGRLTRSNTLPTRHERDDYRNMNETEYGYTVMHGALEEEEEEEEPKPEALREDTTVCYSPDDCNRLSNRRTIKESGQGYVTLRDV